MESNKYLCIFIIISVAQSREIIRQNVDQKTYDLYVKNMKIKTIITAERWKNTFIALEDGIRYINGIAETENDEAVDICRNLSVTTAMEAARMEVNRGRQEFLDLYWEVLRTLKIEVPLAKLLFNCCFPELNSILNALICFDMALFNSMDGSDDLYQSISSSLDAKKLEITKDFGTAMRFSTMAIEDCINPEKIKTISGTDWLKDYHKTKVIPRVG